AGTRPRSAGWRTRQGPSAAQQARSNERWLVRRGLGRWKAPRSYFVDLESLLGSRLDRPTSDAFFLSFFGTRQTQTDRQGFAKHLALLFTLELGYFLDHSQPVTWYG